MVNLPYYGMALRKTAPLDSSATDVATSPARLIIWVGSSKQDISALPPPVKTSFGHRLRQLQEGKTPLDIKPLPHFGSGVFELRERFDRNAYRLM